MKYIKLFEETEPLLKYVTCIKRDAVKTLSTIRKQFPVILMPVEIFDAITEMCNTERETRGVLLIPKTPKKENEIRVLAMLTTGYGSSGSTGIDDNRFRGINKLLSEYRNEVSVIEFHTHTKGTIRDYGEYYLDNFSGGDFNSLRNNLSRNNNYKHVLFTPTSVLTFGVNCPQFRIVQFKNVEPAEENEYWRKILHNKMNEDTSATGGNAGAITGGDVYNMPTSGGSTLGPNAIGNNVGSINMNNIDIDNSAEPERKHKKKKKVKQKVQSQPDEKPIMNWDDYVKKNINKINI